MSKSALLRLGTVQIKLWLHFIQLLMPSQVLAAIKNRAHRPKTGHRAKNSFIFDDFVEVGEDKQKHIRHLLAKGGRS